MGQPQVRPMPQPTAAPPTPPPSPMPMPPTPPPSTPPPTLAPTTPTPQPTATPEVPTPGPAPLVAQPSPHVYNDSELASRVEMVSDTYTQIFGASINPALAHSLAASGMSQADIAKLMSRSAPLFQKMGEGIHVDQPQEDPTTGPQPAKPKQDWFSAVQGLSQSLTTSMGTASNPWGTKPGAVAISQQESAQTIEDVRSILIDQGFLAPSTLPKDNQGQPIDKWDEATVRALLRYYDQNYTNLAQKQHDLQQAGYAWNLKADGILTPEWVKEFGLQTEEQMKVQKVADSLPGFVSLFYKALPHDAEYRQLWFDIAGRNDAGNPIEAVGERILHGLGTGIQVFGSYFPPMIAVGALNALRTVADDPDYNRAMARAHNALGFVTHDEMQKILDNPQRYTDNEGVNAAVTPYARQVGELFDRLIARVTNNATAMAALDEAGDIRDKVIKANNFDPHVIDVFNVIPEEAVKDNPQGQALRTGVQLITDFLLYRKMGMDAEGGAMARIPRGDVRNVIDNQGARLLSNEIAVALNRRDYNMALRLAGDSPDAKRLISTLSAPIRSGDRKALAAAQQAAVAAGSSVPGRVVSGARVLPSKVLGELASRYAVQGHNLATSLTKSARIQSFLDDHADMWWARAASRVPSGKGPEYINPAINPRVFRDIADYAREVYQNPDAVNSVVERMLSARTAGDLAKVVDDINRDIPTYYKTGPIEGAGHSRGYLGMADTNLGTHLVTRDIGGSTIQEEHPVLPSEQRSIAFFHNLWDMQRREVSDTGALGSRLARLEGSVRNIEARYLHNINTFGNKIAFYPRAFMTSLAPAFTTRLAITGRARTLLFSNPNEGDEAAWAAAKAANRLIEGRDRFYKANAMHQEIDYGVNSGFIEKSQGAREMAKKDPALARDFWRRFTQDELAKQYMLGATNPAAGGRFTGGWDFKAGEAQAAKWLSSGRGQRLSLELGFQDKVTGGADTAAHVDALSRSFQSYATHASDAMHAWANGEQLEDIVKIAEHSPQDYYVTGLRRIQNSEITGANPFKRAAMAGWQGFDTRDVPMVNTFLGRFGVNWHIPGSATVSADERAFMYDRLAAQYFSQIKREVPGIDEVRAAQTAQEMALDHTNHFQLNLANMTMAERNLRWVSYFTTKKRLWFSLLAGEAFKNPGIAAGFKNVVAQFEKDNADQPDYLRYSIPVTVPVDIPGFKAGTEVRIPLDRMLWMSELPMFSSLIAFPFTVMRDASGLNNDPSATPSQIGFSRFDSAFQSIYQFARWKQDPSSYKQALGDAYYQKLRADPKVTPDELARYLTLNPELERFYWQVNHERLLAEARGETITAQQAEDRVVFQHLRESGLTLIRPVSGTSLEPERLAFQKMMAEYQMIQDPNAREQYLRDHEDMRKWWFLGTDPQQHDELIRGWQQYYQARGEMDQWAQQFYGQAGDPLAINRALLNRYEAIQKDQEFRDKVTQIAQDNPAWGKSFNSDEFAGKLTDERTRAYALIQSIFPNVKVQQDDVIPDLDRIKKIADLDNLRQAADLFKGTPAESDYNAILGKAAHLEGDLREYNAPASNPNQSIIKDYISNVYFPAMDQLGILFTYIDEAKKAKVPNAILTKFYQQIKSIRNTLDGPFSIDGVKLPGVEAVQWGAWTPDVQHEHMVSWATLPHQELTAFQQDLMSKLSDDERNALRNEARTAKRSGRALLELAGIQ